MTHVTFYDRDGRITRSKTCGVEDDLAAFTPEGGGAWPDCLDDDLWMFVDHAPTLRPEIAASATYEIVADGVAEIAIPLPAGTMADCGGRAVVTDVDEDLQYTTTIAGTHELTLSPPWPWRRKVITVIAHAV
ncbi:hypothetical protein M2360_000937 [Rhizobium sp. SG_E_25_P2]|uniref:hypothetical protein n=1 Tax=Rhizobium sp. SG_E_25_P2 TaxID=2879942 RepID=UPI00247592B8|nr:hypothetical protein [Rhizobium sp. SG_E_25_P2]MDH6265547.1 hypothetical protein [Rhizobium sp. SG_E_25_P2]